MGDKTGIEWCDATWNPIVGCSIVSLGCTNCYAMKMAARIERMKPGSHYAGTTTPSNGGPVWTGKVALAPDHIVNQPLAWKRPRRIFVNSMSDLFHEDVPDAWIDRVFAVMALAPRHTFMVLTKRAKRMREYMTSGDLYARVLLAASPLRSEDKYLCRIPISNPRDSAFWPQLWLGVSAEDQRRADERVPDLLATPAAVRFVSAEPLLGALDFNRVGRNGLGLIGDALRWAGMSGPSRSYGPRIDWLIVGGESGPGARPMHPDWARAIRDQCATAGVPFFMKQLSGPNGRVVKDIGDFPADLQIREFPNAR